MPAHGADPQRVLKGLGSSEHESSWSEFLALYAPILYQVVGLFMREPDPVADCFVFICERLSGNQYARLRKFRPDGAASFSTWLRAVARNLCIDWLRGSQNRARVFHETARVSGPDDLDAALLEQFPDGTPDPEALAAASERTGALRHAVASLPPPERLLIKLRYQEELTLDEVARLAGLKDPQTADRRIREILGVLRGKLIGGSV